MKKLALYALLPSLSLAIASAAPITLDSTFGTAGKVTTSAGAASPSSAFIFDSKLRSDGKLIVAGSAANIIDTDFAVARYNLNGTLDTTFGSAGLQPGIVVTDFGGDDQANSLAVQIDGKMVAAGTAVIGGNSFIALARYNLDGSLDTTFHTNGMLDTDAGTGNGVVVQPNGKIVAVGGNAGNFVVVRYNTDGTPDLTFNLTGKQTTDFGGTDTASSVALQTDGKILVAGSISNGVNSYFGLARYNTDGSPDASFNLTGRVGLGFSGYDIANGLAVQTDGKIVVVGSTGNGYSSSFAIARFNTDGSLDTTFNLTGKLTTTFGGFDTAYKVILQPDGKLIVVGDSSNGQQTDFALARFNTDGSLDNTFNSTKTATLDSTGKVTTDFFALTDSGHTVALFPDGRIVAAGSALNGNNNEFALVRYDGGAGSPYWYNLSYGLLYYTGGNTYSSAELGTLYFGDAYWSYSTMLSSWLWGDGITNRLWSGSFQWLFSSGDGDHWYYSNAIGWIYIGNFNGAVWSIKAGWTFPYGDGVNFYSTSYGWIKCQYGQIWAWQFGRFL